MRKVPELRFDGFDGEWEMGTLSDLGSVSMNKRIYKEETSEIGDVPFYKIGTFGSKADSYISRDLFEEYKSKYPYPKVGDLLISASGSIGKVIEYKGEDAYYQDSNIVWLDVNDKVKNSFLKQFYETVNWNELEGSTIKRLYNKDLLRKKISYPKLSEQEKIGNLFRKLDDLIEIQEDKVAKMRDYKKSMIQKTFPKKGELVPEFRFDGFDGDWICNKSGNVFELISEKDFPDLDVLSATQDKGMILRNDFSSDIQYDKNQLKNYKKVEPGDFVIHLRSFQGGFAHSSIEGITSPAYSVIRIKDEGSHFDLFWKTIFSSQNFINILQKLIYGVRDGKSISFKDFKGIKLRYPTLAEQEKIGNFFKNLDAQIETEKKLLDSYKMMKKSLLQKMFV
ncbi:restriction endonuclease subunit S [uncultured Anaerococcus sp.]|uniref:restriction endonuclease subunit S n=1 Tax=uncultured Anaerococcus sp. TaxID=293428 RepID=UPI002805C2E7|nr:restriction endonuclease subunit S [uncultured Anaerococcus sp.]